MPTFGARSRACLATCDDILVGLCEEVIKYYDFAVIWGYRNEEQQNDCYARGTSKLRFPYSQHNFRIQTEDGLFPSSHAIDYVPWHNDKPHIRWEAELEFVQLSGRFLQAADFLGLSVRYGGDWDMDDDLYDRNVPFDLGHLELL